MRRMHRRGKLLVLTFFAPNAGEPGEQLSVSQRDWEQYGKVEKTDGPVRMADMRKLAR